jgi:hypothetical protein
VAPVSRPAVLAASTPPDLRSFTHDCDLAQAASSGRAGQETGATDRRCIESTSKKKAAAPIRMQRPFPFQFSFNYIPFCPP